MHSKQNIIFTSEKAGRKTEPSDYKIMKPYIYIIDEKIRMDE